MVQKPSSRQNPIFSSAFRTGCAFYRSPTGGRKRPAVSGWRGALCPRMDGRCQGRGPRGRDGTDARVSEQPVFRRKEAKQEAELRPPPARPPPRPAVLFLTTSQPSAGTCSARRRTPVPAPGSGGGRGLPSVRLCSPPRDTCIYYVNVDP